MNDQIIINSWEFNNRVKSLKLICANSIIDNNTKYDDDSLTSECIKFIKKQDGDRRVYIYGKKIPGKSSLIHSLITYRKPYQGISP